MSSPAYELARYLEANGIGQFGGNSEWSIHVSREPEQPVNVITLYDTPGGGAPIVVDGLDLRQPGIQVRVRSDDYLAAYEVQKEIHALLAQPGAAELDAPLERTIEGARYVSINLVGDMIAIGRDDEDRQVVVANYQCLRQPLEGS